MPLVSNSALATSASTGYNLTDFARLQKELMDRVMETRAQGNNTGISGEIALETMEHSHQFISTLFKVGSLANVLNAMGLYAPIFRRACPEPYEGLVNLPRRLTAMEAQLKYYAALDVLQEEAFIKLGNGPGLRWLYGVPDRLMVVLARMNTLFEESGNRLDPRMVQDLENEIAACTPVVSGDTGADPLLNIGAIMVQASWELAARVYLYMGLCGMDSSDARVIKVQKGFMKLLGNIRPRRSPDSFLILPTLILGVATSSPTSQSSLLARLWGISECNRPGTVGNDVVRMLDDIWARATGRPTVWADLRIACLNITGT